MSKIKKVLKKIMFIVGIILLPIIILIGVPMCLFIALLSDWILYDDSACWDKWGYEKEWYTMNCVMCLENKGCVSVKVLDQIKKDVCGDYPYKCTIAQKLEVAKRICKEYPGVINIETTYCDYDFQLKDCGKRKGHYLYPKECGLPPEMTY